ncbi:MAG: DUF2264 domain-containing protein [Clostridiales Family XIII bacterium]|nr:DUF2264 domain-containing protein [Clostridiales Family XIII bacterium]
MLPEFKELQNNPLLSRADYALSLETIALPALNQLTEAKPGLLNIGSSGTLYSESTIQAEGFLRLFWGYAGYYVHHEADATFAKLLKGVADGVNPESENYWGDITDYDQLMVEMAPLAVFLVLNKDKAWSVLTDTEKQNIFNWLDQINVHEPVKNNWLFFRVLVNVFLNLNYGHDSRAKIEEDLETIEGFYIGNGWYNDGRDHQFEYYIPFAMHYYSLIYSKIYGAQDPERSKLFKARAVTFAKTFRYWFDKDGRGIPFGRSLTYRFAQSSFWSAMVFAGVDFDKDANGVDDAQPTSHTQSDALTVGIQSSSHAQSDVLSCGTQSSAHASNGNLFSCTSLLQDEDATPNTLPNELNFASTDRTDITLSEVKHYLSGNLHYWFNQKIFSTDGILKIGYAYENLAMAEEYNGPGSPYWAFKAFIGLGADDGDDNEFWKITPKPYTNYELTKLSPESRQLIVRKADDSEIQNFPAGQYNLHHISGEAKYAKFVYSTTFGFNVPRGSVTLERGGFDSVLAVSEQQDDFFRVRTVPESFEVTETHTKHVWKPWDDVQITSIIIPAFPFHVRVHEIQSARKLRLSDGGFSVPFVEKDSITENAISDSEIYLVSSVGTSGIEALHVDANFTQDGISVRTPDIASGNVNGLIASISASDVGDNKATNLDDNNTENDIELEANTSIHKADASVKPVEPVTSVARVSLHLPNANVLYNTIRYPYLLTDVEPGNYTIASLVYGDNVPVVPTNGDDKPNRNVDRNPVGCIGDNVGGSIDDRVDSQVDDKANDCVDSQFDGKADSRISGEVSDSITGKTDSCIDGSIRKPQVTITDTSITVVYNGKTIEVAR